MADCSHDFDDLLAANRDFADDFDLGGFDGIAHAGVAIVTCMDSRIDPLRMVGLEPGDAKIFRNPGGRVTAAGARGAGARRPPAQRAADPGRPAHPLRDGVGHRGRAARAGRRVRRDRRLAGQSFHVVADQLEPLRQDVAKVRTHPLIGDRAQVGGFIYDVDTGLLARHA